MLIGIKIKYMGVRTKCQKTTFTKRNFDRFDYNRLLLNDFHLKRSLYKDKRQVKRFGKNIWQIAGLTRDFYPDI